MKTVRLRGSPEPGNRTVTFIRSGPGQTPLGRWAIPAMFFAYAAWSIALMTSGQPIPGALSALVWAELGLLRARLVMLIGGVVADESLEHRIGPMLVDLCDQARCPVPCVVLRNDWILLAGVARKRGQIRLILSQPYIHRLDDDALRAVLAHEVMHLTHRDLLAARVRLVSALLVGMVAAITVAAVTQGGVRDLPVWLAAFLVGTMAALAVLSPLNRRRERRADRGAVALGGDPAALSRALIELQATTEGVRRQLLGTSPLRWLLWPVSWRPQTHPAMEDRVAWLSTVTPALPPLSEATSAEGSATT